MTKILPDFLICLLDYSNSENSKERKDVAGVITTYLLLAISSE